MDMRKLGGGWQLFLRDLSSLEHALSLDEALWVASSAPISALAADPVFLANLDTDKNGRVHVAEVRAAIRWTLARLSDRSAAGSDALPLSHLDRAIPEGEHLWLTAVQVLNNLDLGEAQAITLQAVRDRQRILADDTANGDGVIPPSPDLDPEVRALIEDAILVTGGVRDASGRTGLDEPGLDAFLKVGASWLGWSEGAGDRDLAPFGDDTPALWAAWGELRPAVEDHWARCAEAAWHQASGTEPQVSAPLPLAQLPISPAAPSQRLDPAVWLHPRWEQPWARLSPLWGGGALDRPAWERLCVALLPFDRWQAARPSGKIAEVPSERLRRWLAPEGPAEALRDLMRGDAAVARELNRVAELERLILNQRWLLEFANNFVNFSHFYDPDRVSLVERGALVIDGRRHTLTVRVEDVAAHKAIAVGSRLFLLYTKVIPRGDEAPMTVAAAVTSGTRGHLERGKRGVFVLPGGEIRDAEVVDVLENPISLWEAIAAPFTKVGSLISGLLESFSRSREAQIEGVIRAEASSTEAQLQGLPKPPPPPEEPTTQKVGALRDTLVGGGVALAAVSSSFAYMANTLTSIDLVQLGSIVAVLVLGATVPTVILAVLKLRARNLGAVLEGSGWAINHPMPLPRWAGSIFTRSPALPRAARRTRRDQLAEYLRRSR
ncbi:MAG: hypothetical protein JXX28_15760 [Deltaproteobacteria bacterium]|nr:hypothetical protein [Deltaproteobacteria bacterium]